MPLYEYQCEACGLRFELIQKYADAPAETCAKCGQGPVHKLLSSPAIQFKGSGWYVTDYAQKGKSDGSVPTGKTEKSESAPSGASSSSTDSSSASAAGSTTSPDKK